MDHLIKTAMINPQGIREMITMMRLFHQGRCVILVNVRVDM